MTQTYLRELTYSALITGVPCDAVPDWDDRPEGQSALRLPGPFRSGVRGTCVALSGCETPPFRVAAGDRSGCFFLSRRTFRSGGRTAESGGRRFKSDRWLCCFRAAARFSSSHPSQAPARVGSPRSHRPSRSKSPQGCGCRPERRLQAPHDQKIPGPAGAGESRGDRYVSLVTKRWCCGNAHPIGSRGDVMTDANPNMPGSLKSGEVYGVMPAHDAVRARQSSGRAGRPLAPGMSHFFSWPCGLLVSAILLPASCRSPATTPAWLVERARQEAELAARSQVVHDFRFTDRREASGITFQNRIVDDAGKAYKLVHYDHGSGLCAADVDGDGLPDLYFVTQLGTNELWKNLGGGRFANITDEAGLTMGDAVAVGCAFADIDNDGDPDLFVTTVGVYTSNTKGPGGYYVGLPDAFHGHTHPERAETSILYHNLGGNRFEDVTRRVGLVDSSWSGDATVIDVNDDGWPDLYVLDMQGENHLWQSAAGKRFHDATRQYFSKTPWGAMGVKAFDFNGDGRLDLFVTDMHSDMWVNIPAGDWAAEARKADTLPAPVDFFPTGKSRFIFGNALFANGGDGRFAEVSDSVGVETYWPWGPSVDDLNADGWDDIFIAASMNFPYRYGINSVLLNDGGHRFLPSEFVVGVEPRPNGATEQVWFTLDCTGAGAFNPWCVACSKPGARASACRLDAARQLTMMGSLGTRAAVALDLDGDGDLDIVTNEFNGRPQVLVSDLAQRHHIHFLKVRLRGTRSNREGLGAQVTVVLPEGRRILKVLDGKSGYLSQSDLPLYFGLADADHAAKIEVRWPSGRRQTLVGPIQAGQTIDVVEP